MRALYCTYLLLACAFAAHAQQAFRLKISDAATGRLLAPVAITVIDNNRIFYTGDDGIAYVPGAPGGLVSLSFVGFQTMTMTLPGTPGTLVELRMKPLVRELQEVIIRPDHYSPYQRDSIERREVYARPLARQRSGSIMSPATLLAEKFSKRSKQIFAFQKQFNYWEGQRFIDSRYTPELVTAMTSLQGDSLAYFMNAYPVPLDYARAATDLELKMWIRTNYRAWLKHPTMQVVADSLVDR